MQTCFLFDADHFDTTPETMGGTHHFAALNVQIQQLSVAPAPGHYEG
ncbi:MAG: hypothetical protein HOH74_07125 [Gemmatimonadetes bacterium]|nr:hypothetical protein [Gemmatimonadota bacterium]